MFVLHGRVNKQCYWKKFMLFEKKKNFKSWKHRENILLTHGLTQEKITTVIHKMFLHKFIRRWPTLNKDNGQILSQFKGRTLIYNVPTIYMQKENFQSDLDSGFVNKYNK